MSSGEEYESGSPYGECEDCGFVAAHFEEARIHARDKHGGITPGMLDRFKEGDDV